MGIQSREFGFGVLFDNSANQLTKHQTETEENRRRNQCCLNGPLKIRSGNQPTHRCRRECNERQPTCEMPGHWSDPKGPEDSVPCNA